MAAAIEIQNLTVRYGDTLAVCSVDLAVPRGQTVGLLGSNGAGKTTLLRTVAGLLRQSAGRVAVEGVDDAAGRRAAVAFGPHAGLAWPVPVHLVGEALADAWPGFRGDRFLSLTEQLALPADRLVSQLSAGQTARLRLAYALSRPGSVLVLDEPLAAIDPASRDRIAQVLAEHLAETGQTTLVATHEVSYLEALLERVVLLRDGKVACDEGVEGLRERTGTSVETWLRREPSA